MDIKSTIDIKPTKLNAIIFGNSGCGKTTLASTLQGKTIVVSLESGLLSLRKFNVDYVEIKSITPKSRYEQLQKTMIEISKSDYENVFIDSLTDIAQTFVDCAKEDFPDPKQSFPMWGKYNERINSFLKYTRDMDKNVFYTALMKTEKDELGRRYNAPDLAGSISTKSAALFDFVFPMISFKNEEGELKRVLITSSDDTYISKDRSSSLNAFEEPNLSNIINKVFNQGEKND